MEKSEDDREKLFIAAMQEYDQYLERHTRLQAAMKEGFSGLTSARYASPLGITQLQYDYAHMEPSALVAVSAEEGRPHVFCEEQQEKDKRSVRPVQVCCFWIWLSRSMVSLKVFLFFPGQWFGLLPSQGMRAAEKHFEQSLKLALECCDHLIEIQQLVRAFEEKK